MHNIVERPIVVEGQIKWTCKVSCIVIRHRSMDRKDSVLFKNIKENLGSEKIIFKIYKLCGKNLLRQEEVGGGMFLLWTCATWKKTAYLESRGS